MVPGSSRLNPSAFCRGRFLYCYEVSDRPDQKGLIIARVPPAQIENPAAYRFYNGKDWTAGTIRRR